MMKRHYNNRDFSWDDVKCDLDSGMQVQDVIAKYHTSSVYIHRLMYENAYVFYNKVSGGSSAENVVDGSTGKIDTAAQVENVGDYTGAVKNEVNPKTGDKSYTIFWIICVLISAGLVIYTGTLLFKNEKKGRK